MLGIISSWMNKISRDITRIRNVNQAQLNSKVPVILIQLKLIQIKYKIIQWESELKSFLVHSAVSKCFYDSINQNWN